MHGQLPVRHAVVDGLFHGTIMHSSGFREALPCDEVLEIVLGAGWQLYGKKHV